MAATAATDFERIKKRMTTKNELIRPILIGVPSVQNRRLWLSRLWFLLGIPMIYIIVEALAGVRPFRDLALWRIAWNLLWYLAVFVLFWLVTGYRRTAGAFSAVLSCYILGLINHFVIQFRGTMFFPIDILNLRTAVNVSKSYTFTIDATVWITLAAVLGYLWMGLAAFWDIERRMRPPRRLPAVLAVSLTLFLWTFFCSSLLPSVDLYPQQWSTRSNGFLFNFMLSLRYSNVDEPEGYSEALVEEIQSDVHEEIELEEHQEVPLDAGAQDTPDPNILIIMNESLADLSIYEALETSEDPLEFIHSLRDNTLSGWFYSPVFGGGTAHVEYEMLTGNPSLFLPSNTVAYQHYLDDATPSIASVLEELGYVTCAFHPHIASGWNRPQAYERLGFDHQLYDEDVPDPKLVREYISDESDMEMLISLTEQEEAPVLVHNVTMQNHGGYGMEWTNLPKTIEATVNGQDAPEELEQYLNLVDLSDAAFERLISYYSQCEEPTVIALFGDHQPYLPDAVYDQFLEQPEEELSNAERLEKYRTPFVIWSNYDIEEQSDISISGNYFGLLVMRAAGIAFTEYMELAEEAMLTLPVIHKLGFLTSDGSYVPSIKELDEAQRELLNAYEILAYHNQFERESGDDFYEEPIEVTAVVFEPTGSG